MDMSKQLLAAALGVALLAGCGKTGGDAPSATAAKDQRGPDAVIGEFLAAIKKGDDKSASSLLTTVARQKTSEMEMVVAPPGSETASYKVIETEIEGDKAQVGTDWTDLDIDGQPRTDRIVWMLRQEETDGWRISGMATRVFPDMAPIILNFEDPIDMLRKQQQAEEEIARRDAQAQGTETTETADGAEATTVR